MEKNEKASLAHKDYHTRSKEAVNTKHYLEALCLEYSAMESRVASILKMLGMPCGDLNNKDTFDIGIHVKLNCLKKCLKDDIFKKSKLTNKTIKDIISWKYHRNEVMHRLYAKPEEYDKLMENIKTYAEDGLDYCYILYKEADRIRYIKKHHPEVLERFEIRCPSKSATCIKFLEKNSQL